jgi:hypothetical protein
MVLRIGSVTQKQNISVSLLIHHLYVITLYHAIWFSCWQHCKIVPPLKHCIVLEYYEECVHGILALTCRKGK